MLVEALRADETLEPYIPRFFELAYLIVMLVPPVPGVMIPAIYKEAGRVVVEG